MTQEFPANEASARAYTVGKKLSVLPKKDLSQTVHHCLEMTSLK